LNDLPYNSSYIVAVSLYGFSINKISCGFAGISEGISVGILETGSNLGVINFSSIDRDTYGTITLVPRRNVPRTTHTLVSHIDNIDTLVAIRDQLNAEICLWVGNLPDLYTPYLATVGIYRKFSIVAPLGDYVQINLELESL
jgi:hypothetical protein